jgi:hypothetical protein
VNAAYTSQVDSRHGVLLGTRDGDQFFTFDHFLNSKFKMQNAKLGKDNFELITALFIWVNHKDIK